MWGSEPHPGCCSKLDSCNKPERQYLSDKALAIFTSCAVNFRVHISQADGRGSRTASLFNVGRAGLYRFLKPLDVMKRH